MSKSLDMSDLADYIAENFAAAMDVPGLDDIDTLEKQKEAIILMLPTMIPKMMDRLADFMVRPVIEAVEDSKGNPIRFYELIECSPMWEKVSKRIELGFERHGNDVFEWDAERLTKEMFEEVADMLVYGSVNMFVLFHSALDKVDDLPEEKSVWE